MTLLETNTRRPPSFIVSCLKCGGTRRTHRTQTGHLSTPECPSCGYLGWRELRDGGDAVAAR